MKWNNIKITIFKEIRGIVRDKKSLHRLLLFPIIIPFMIFLFGMLFDTIENSKYDVGINYELTKEEKTIIKDLKNINIVNYDNEKELKKAYKNKEINGYVVKDNNIYTIYTDRSSNSGEIIYSYMNAYLETYNKILANDYLKNNKIDTNKVFNNVIVKEKSTKVNENEGTDNTMFTILLNLTITYVLMIVVMTCVVVATDATSGEKERGTLETILTFPIKSSELVAGKYLATAILGCILGIISYLLTVPSIYVGKIFFKAFEEVSINVDVLSTFLVLLVIVLSSLLAAGLCMALAGNTRTYKEAQSSLQFISLLPMIPYFVKVMESDTSMFNLVPIANCGMALSDITMNNIDYHSLLIILLSSVVYIVLILIYISKQYKSEKTLFG